MSGLFGIGGSSAKTDRSNQLASFGTLKDVSAFGASTGKSAITDAVNYFKSLLSGDPTKISEAIGPETKAIQDQGEQKLKTLSEFGDRSGGTNAAAQKVSTDVSSSVQALIDSLIPKAAAELGSLGLSTLTEGESAAANLGGLAGSSRNVSLQQQSEAGQAGGQLAALLMHTLFA